MSRRGPRRSARRRHSTAPPNLRPAWVVAGVLAVTGVLIATLRPDDLPASVNLEPLEHHGRALHALLEGHPNWKLLTRYLVTDVLGNLALFLPVGITAAGSVAAWPPAGRLAAAGAFGLVLSVVIELVQLGIPGRASDVDDVIFNTVGAVVGAAVHAVVARRRFGVD